MLTVYVLEGEKKRYVGITNNLDRRLAEHRSGSTKGGQIIGQFRLLHAEEREYSTFFHGFLFFSLTSLAQDSYYGYDRFAHRFLSF